MVVRDTPAPSGRTTLEVLMVRRNLRSDFVGGAYVFPGGAVDFLDGGAEAEALSVGRSDAEASTLLGVESGGLAYWVAVVRGRSRRPGSCCAERGPAAPTSSPVTPKRRHDSPPPGLPSTPGPSVSSSCAVYLNSFRREPAISKFV